VADLTEARVVELIRQEIAAFLAPHVALTGAFTDSCRAKLHGEFDATLGADVVDKQIDLALSYQGARKYKRLDLYVWQWLRREAERAKQNQHAGIPALRRGEAQQGKMIDAEEYLRRHGMPQ